MADVRKLLQAERRQREANNKKNPATSPPPRASGKRPFSESSSSSSKRTKISAPTTANLPADFFSGGPVSSNERVEILDSRASKPTTTTTTTDDDPMSEATTSLPQDFFQKNNLDDVDEDEWAAFQAEVAADSLSAATPGVPPVATVITAAPTLNGPGGEHEQRVDDEDEYGKGEEEDAKQKLLDEFEEMEGLEQRVLRLKERREALKSKHPIMSTQMEVVEVEVAEGGGLGDGDDDDDDDEYEEDDDFFRARGS